MHPLQTRRQVHEKASIAGLAKILELIHQTQCHLIIIRQTEFIVIVEQVDLVGHEGLHVFIEVVGQSWFKRFK